MKPKFEIFVPSCRTFAIQCDGHAVENWLELEEEAKAAVEPLIRARWAAYWDCIHTKSSTIDIQGDTLCEVMYTLVSPSMFYPCSPELAAKSIIKEGQDD